MALIDDIRALPPEVLATKDTQQITDALPPVIEWRHTEVGNGTILEVLGLVVGNALLDVLYTVPDFRYVKPLLDQGRLRIDSVAARYALDGIAAAGLAAGFGPAESEQLKAIAKRTVPVDEMAVRKACWSDDGVWQV